MWDTHLFDVLVTKSGIHFLNFAISRTVCTEICRVYLPNVSPGGAQRALLLSSLSECEIACKINFYVLVYLALVTSLVFTIVEHCGDMAGLLSAAQEHWPEEIGTRLNFPEKTILKQALSMDPFVDVSVAGSWVLEKRKT